MITSYFSSLSEAMSILKNSHKQTGNDTELRAELHKKDEELRKIQKNMTQWKVLWSHHFVIIQYGFKQSTAKRLAKKFEDELKKMSDKASGLLGDVESGFESFK